MLLHRTLATGLLMGLALLLAPVGASAEIISGYEPTEYDYGDVIVGESESQIFTVTLQDAGDLLYYTSQIFYADNDAFTITAAPVDGSNIETGTYFEVEVTFAPTTVGAHEATLQITSNAINNPIIEIPLYGLAVPDEPGPAEEMAELIALYEASVADGTLVGYGCCDWLADMRLAAFGNLLYAANDLIGWGYDWLACGTLGVADRRSDGVTPPPDFIAGANREAINAAILEVRELLGCWYWE
jgi:hypothetical protein